MTQQELGALLGRPLTAKEVTNLDLYIDIAKENLESLLCMPLDVKETDAAAEARTFDVREGFSTVFTDIFTEITEVKIDGAITTDYYSAFWDKRNSPYYNSIVLGNRRGDTVEITGSWGFDTLPKDLQRLWAQVFAIVSKKRSVSNVKSKKVEDFSIVYGDLSDDEQFQKDNATTINKYRMCNIGYVRHGSTCNAHGVRDCGYCL